MAREMSPEERRLIDKSRNYLMKFKGDGDHIRGSWKKCWVCKLPTRSIELNFETHIHRGICSRIAWRRFEKATRPTRESKPVWPHWKSQD